MRCPKSADGSLAVKVSHPEDRVSGDTPRSVNSLQRRFSQTLLQRRELRPAIRCRQDRANRRRPANEVSLSRLPAASAGWRLGEFFAAMPSSEVRGQEAEGRRVLPSRRDARVALCFRREGATLGAGVKAGKRPPSLFRGRATKVLASGSRPPNVRASRRRGGSESPYPSLQTAVVSAGSPPAGGLTGCAAEGRRSAGTPARRSAERGGLRASSLTAPGWRPTLFG